MIRNNKLIKYSIKSSLWCGIKEHYGTILENCIWSVGNGQKVNFWMDNWIGEPLAAKFNVPEVFHKALKSIAHDWWKDGKWNLSSNIQTACPSLLNYIAVVSISALDNHDLFVWKSITNGMLSMKEAYKFIIKPCPLDKWISFPWSTPAYSIIIWRYMHHKRPTDDNMHIIGFSLNSICNLC